MNLYNNQWDTNFPLWQEGPWSSRIRLWVVRGGPTAETLTGPSWEARVPLIAAFADGPRGKLPVQSSGLAVSRAGGVASYVGPAPYGDKVLVRLWDLAGISGKVEVSLPDHFSAFSAVPINLRGEPEGKPLKIKNGSFEANLPAFAPASFLLE